MQGTLDTPWGKLRCGSTRRYILVHQDRRTGKPSIVKRSDTLDKLRAIKGSQERIIDTHTKQLV